MECNVERRTAKIEFNFEVCTDHGQAHAESGGFESGGVPPEDAVGGFLSVIEQIIAQFLGQNEKVVAMLAQDRGEFTLNERAQFRVLRVMANQFMIRQVTSREYPVGRASALLSLPFEVSGDDDPPNN